MNSALQCLSNTLPLTEYFLSRIYKKEVNTTNILGTNGKLAKIFAKFLSNLWIRTKNVFNPHKVKKEVGNAN